MSIKYDKILIFLWPIFAVVISLLFNVSFLTSIFIFFGVPSVYISFRNPSVVKKAGLFSIVTTPFVVVIDYIMEITGGWFIPVSAFDPFRLFGYVTIDILIWFFLYVFFMIMYYETFLDGHRKNQTYSKRLKYLSLILLSALAIFILTLLTRPEYLNIDYFYLKAGLFLVITPIITMLFKFQALYSKLLKAAAYFFFLTFSYEITALELGIWSFPGKDFVGLVNFLGHQFPIEEFVFWILLFAMAFLIYYEFWDDDGK